MAFLSALLVVVAPGVWGADLPSYPDRLFDGGPIAAMVPGDFDGDGDRDILLQREQETFFAFNVGGRLRGQEQVFGAAWLPDLENPDDHVRSLVRADLDGDGSPDVAVLLASESGNADLRVARCNAARDCNSRAIVSFGTFSSMAAGDLDGDGADELLICARNFSDPSMRLFIVRWAFGVDPEVSELSPPPAEPFSVVYLRGTPGRILAASHGAVYAAPVGAGGSPGGWSEIPSFAPYAWSLRAGDIDGDGEDEAILWGTSAVAVGKPGDGSVREIYEGDALTDVIGLPDGVAIADGSYDALVHVDLSQGLDLPRKTVYSTGGIPQRLAAEDITGDGRLDLAVGLRRDLWYNGQRPDSVVVAEGEAGGGFRLPRNFSPAGITLRDIELADLDTDGDLDAVVAGGDILVVLERKGSEWVEHQRIRAGAPLGGLRIADLDGDGLLDIVAAGSLRDLPVGESVWIFRAVSSLTFADPPAAYPVGPYPLMVEIGDLDRNGTPDIAAAVYGPPSSGENEGHLAALIGKSDGTFFDAQTFPAGLYARGLVLADLDGDAALDALLPASRLDWDAVIHLKGKGDGSFEDAGDLEGLHGHYVLHADVDGDGEREIAFAGRELILCETSLAGLADPTRIALDFSPAAIGAGDADGDGIPDILLARHPGEGVPDDRILRLSGQGGGAFGQGADVLTGNGPLCMDVAALAAGAEPVLVVAGCSTRIRTSFLVTLPCAPSAPPEFLRGDANGDGTLDLSDAVATLRYLFQGGAVACADAADSNDDNVLDITDPIYLLLFLFASGLQPADPYPDPGTDPTADDIDCQAPDGPVLPPDAIRP